MDDTYITTSKLANQSGVNLGTIRYYERLGLLPKPPRSAAGYRLYAPESLQRVGFIKRRSGVGFLY